jgi:hypothetical protein
MVNIITKNDKPAHIFISGIYRLEIYHSGEFCMIDTKTDVAITDTVGGIEELLQCINFLKQKTNGKEIQELLNGYEY